jgi:uncharacterized protein (TIGR02996 family)
MALMGDDEVFLRAIADAPHDDTTRLVYADWLEEQGDSPRANYLRLECEWGALPVPPELACHGDKQLPPSDGRYWPVLRRLTEVGRAIPPGWLASVSRIRQEIQALLGRVRTPISVNRACEPAPEFGACVARWQAAVEDVRRMFESHVGERTTRERFAVPIDYMVFATVVNGGLAIPEDGLWAFNFDALFDPTEMARRTIGCCRWEAKLHDPVELWLFIGHREKHHFHLCCDWGSPYFGVMVDMEDSDPWMRPVLPYEVITRSFLDYLRRQVADAERYRDEGER